MQRFRAASLRVFDRGMVRIVSTAVFCRTNMIYSNAWVLQETQGEVDLYAKVIGLGGRRGRIWYLSGHLGPFRMPCW